MIKFFKTESDFRKWLSKNHDNSDELWIGFKKVGSGKKSITYSEALDQALCFGWIDGIRKSIDEESYKIRFTPRKKNSKWSKVNIEKAKVLLKSGLMTEPGIKAFQDWNKNGSIKYSYEEKDKKLSREFEKIFKTDNKAWTFFQKQPPYYQKTASFWIMSAKKDDTKMRRLSRLINDSKIEKRIDELNPKYYSQKRK
jgi:uncharacterized protein YdeI (YjbR/CyaY-like superfamily)